MPGVGVRRSVEADIGECVSVVLGLREFFTDDVPGKLERDLRAHQGWVATSRRGVAAFAVIDQRSSEAAEILWMAVHAERRGQGIGGALLDRILEALRTQGVRLVEVKTLDASANYEPYVATRAFWERHGFVHFDTIDPFPGWAEGNPAALYVCALSTTR